MDANDRIATPDEVQRVRRMECDQGGHRWDVIERLGTRVPQAVICSHCGDGPYGVLGSSTRSQIYYWSKRWQAEEAESLAEIESGSARRFESAQDAVRWLQSSEEPGRLP